MLTQPIALVPEAADAWQSRSHSTVPAWSAELLRVGAALQNQVSHDLGPLWGVQATVNVFAALEEVPVGYWPIIVRDGELGTDAGIHLDEHGQPYARVALGPLWSMAASRACLEMLVNPYGDRCVSAPSPRSGLERPSEAPSSSRGSAREQSTVQVLVEVCGPCADPALGYAIHGVMVSDFCLPSFFAASARDARERLSFRHGLAAPFEPHAGGHLTWFDPVSNLWWVRRHTIDGAVDTRLGPVDRKLTSARRLVHQHLVASEEVSLLTHTQVQEDAQAAQEYAEGAARARAQRLRAQLGSHSEVTQALLQEGTSELDAGDLEEVEARAEEQELAQEPEQAEEPAPEALDEVQLDASEEYDPDASVSEDELAEAVELVSYDSASDVLTESVPPALPGARAELEPGSAGSESKTITPVPPLPSIAPPPLAKPRSAGQLSMLSEERRDTPRRGVFGVGLGLMGAAAAVWFLSASPKDRPQEAKSAKSAQPAAETPKVGAGASNPSEPPVDAKALAPAAVAPAAVAPAAVAPATVAPATEAKPSAEQIPVAERRRTRRERPTIEPSGAATGSVPAAALPSAPAVRTSAATPAPEAAPPSAQAPAVGVRPTLPSTTAAAPVAAARPASTASASDALEDLIESRR